MSRALSICIPTYNFGAFIGATLDSVLAQASDNLEIVVLDGGSTDDTEAVVALASRRHAGVRYVRQPQRGGIDRDLARAIELAEGDYCWLFSADDLMLPGAIDHALTAIRSGADVYLASFTLATLHMQPLRRHADLALDKAGTFNLADADERAEYFRLACSTVAFFSFMGSLIVRRARWLSVPFDERYAGSCWAHVARLFQLANTSLKVRYLDRSLLLKRADNDSFMDRGIVHRIAIAIEGYERLGADFFGAESAEASHIRRTLRAEFSPYALLYVKQQAVDTGGHELERLNRLASTVYRDAGWRGRVALLIFRVTPVTVFRNMRALLRLARDLIHRSTPTP
jgi:abequosyltransferase